MELHERRALLVSRPNPDSGLDYVSGLQGMLQAFGHGRPTRVNVHYVPDRTILEQAAFGRYLETLTALDWGSLEELATAVLTDLNNELVTRWLRVVVTAPEGAYPGVGAHHVTIEDRQPDWDSPALLSRLPDA